MSFTNPFGCGPGSPCREILNQINTYNDPKYYPTANDSLSCFTENTIPCSAITHCISGGTSSKTPVSIVSNSMYVEKPKQLIEYIGNENSGFSGGAWDWPKTSFTLLNINCGVPFPGSIGGSVTGAINVCGNLLVGGHTSGVTVTIKIYTFECIESGTPSLTQLGSTSKSFPVPDEGETGVNKCWSLDVSTEDPIVECTNHFLISFGIGSGEVAKILKSSYKATIEKS